MPPNNRSRKRKRGGALNNVSNNTGLAEVLNNTGVNEAVNNTGVNAGLIPTMNNKVLNEAINNVSNNKILTEAISNEGNTAGIKNTFLNKKYTFIQKLAGSTQPKLYKNNSAKKWVIKRGSQLGGFTQTKYESLANDIYDAVGVPVPYHILDTSKEALILEFIDGKPLSEIKGTSQYDSMKKQLQAGFVVDALLANWDVIGLTMDNILIPNDGSPPVRIDNGGTFMFRAQGGAKPFNKIVMELDTMRSPSTAPQASQVFGAITNAEIDQQIKTLIIPNYDKILAIVSEKAPKETYTLMKNRLDYLVERTVWTNATQFKNTTNEKETPEFIDAVQKALVNFFKPGKANALTNVGLLDMINTLLISNKTIISGGFILKSIGAFVDEKSVDMDIYVPTEYAAAVRDKMGVMFGATNFTKHVMSDAPNSFFKKNGIVSVTKYSRTEPVYAELDIVEVNKDRMPIDVIKNFDLTFCENWYDGKTVYMVHPDHVEAKSGFLENHYLSLLFKKNPVLINRVKKYMGRGFKVFINNPVTKEIQDITSYTISEIVPVIPQAQPQAKPKVQYSRTSAAIVPINAASKYNLKNILDSIPATFNSALIENIKNIANVNKHTVENTNKIMQSIIPTSLNVFERDLLKYYTSNGFNPINMFLYNKYYIPSGMSQLYIFFSKVHPRIAAESLQEYNTRLLYYYFVNLYSIIMKAPKATAPFMVLRGIKTWHLKEDTTKFYYFNSFMSTTTSENIAKSFGLLTKNYTFYVHPSSNYINVTNISAYSKEKEILFAPYNRCFFIDDGSTSNKKYIVLPSDLTIPNTQEEFMTWKDTVAELSSTKTGGRLATIDDKSEFYNMNNSMYGRETVRRNMTKKLNMVRRNNKTRNIRNMKSVTAPNKVVPVETTRFNTPIASFAGKPPTEKELIMIKDIMQYFQK